MSFATGVGTATEFYGDETAAASTTLTAKNGATTWGTTTVAITPGTAANVSIKPDGSLGERNDVRCVSIEHKLGIHASPTCVMAYGDAGSKCALPSKM